MHPIFLMYFEKKKQTASRKLGSGHAKLTALDRLERGETSFHEPGSENGPFWWLVAVKLWITPAI